MADNSSMEIRFPATGNTLRAWTEPRGSEPSVWVQWIMANGREEPKLCVPTAIAVVLFRALSGFAAAIDTAAIEKR